MEREREREKDEKKGVIVVCLFFIGCVRKANLRVRQEETRKVKTSWRTAGGSSLEVGRKVKKKKR